jgi:hypothetical protein
MEETGEERRVAVRWGSTADIEPGDDFNEGRLGTQAVREGIAQCLKNIAWKIQAKSMDGGSFSYPIPSRIVFSVDTDGHFVKLIASCEVEE